MQEEGQMVMGRLTHMEYREEEKGREDKQRNQQGTSCPGCLVAASAAGSWEVWMSQ